MFDEFSAQDVASDYVELLRCGFVFRLLAADKHDAWRSAMRAKARADLLRVKTRSVVAKGVTPRVFASLRDREHTMEDLLYSIGKLGFVDEDGNTDLEAWREWFENA